MLSWRQVRSQALRKPLSTNLRRWFSVLNNQVLELVALPGASRSLVEIGLNTVRGSPVSPQSYENLLVFYFYCKSDHWLLYCLFCMAWC